MNRLRHLLVSSVVVLLLGAAPAGAVTGGTPDGTAHPYVGFLYNPTTDTICSGSLLSPSLFLTAAHCFAGDGDVGFVTAHPQAVPGHPSFVPGLARVHPSFCFGCGPGLPRLDTHDVAVVQLAAPIASPRYAELPALGLSDRLGRSSVTVVGYGVQGFANGPGGKQPFSDFTRTTATATLSPGSFSWRDEFLRLSANKGGVCLGDSGGPNLVGDTVVAITSYVGRNCTGNTYSYRLDTVDAQSFVDSFR